MKIQVIPENDRDDIRMDTVSDDQMTQLRELQHIIGGYVQEIRTNTLHFQMKLMLVDEEGALKMRKPNFRAMSMSGYTGLIFGTVVVCSEKRTDEGGLVWTDYPEDQASRH